MTWAAAVILGMMPTAYALYWAWRADRSDAKILKNARKDS